MKSYKQFCVDANILEQWWNPQVPDLTNKIYNVLGGNRNKPKTPVAKPKPQRRK